MIRWAKGYAIVLGCSSGVGGAIATHLARKGYGIMGFHRGNHPKEAAETCAKVMECGVPGQFLIQDAGSTFEAFEKAFAAVNAHVGQNQVAVLAHSLSGAAIGSPLTLPQTRVETTFNNLAHSFLWWTRALYNATCFIPGSQAIALSNPCPDFYLRGSGVIGAAKAALEAYVKMLAVEAKGRPRVNCLRFGTVLTPALLKVMPTAVERLEKLHQQIVPVGRMQTSEDVAHIVDGLVDMPWFNGAVIDGTGASPYKLMDYAFHGTR